MSDVPKFVRQRLAQQAAGEHPDANLLAAFAEDALTQRERTQVLAHLSSCAACRETVALALPEVPATVSAAAPSGTRWARWPMLRWAGLAAAVVVVAAAVVIENSRRPVAPPEFARTGAAGKQAEAHQPQASQSPMAETKSVPVQQDRARKQADKNARGSSRPDVGTARLFDSEAQQSASALRMAPPQAKAEARLDKKKDAAGQSAEVASSPRDEMVVQRKEVRPPREADVVTKIPATPEPRPQNLPQSAAVAGGLVEGRGNLDQAKSQPVNAAPPPAANETVEVVGQSAVVSTEAQAKTRAPKSMAATGAVGGPAMAKAVYSTGAARWRVSAEGAVERTFDAGQSWQRVVVAGTREKFRCVAVVDDEVWAGGVRAALYHSIDNGRTWTRVAVRTDDAALEGDIARVDFSDARHGTVTTTAGETWSTGDGGATWTLR